MECDHDWRQSPFRIAMSKKKGMAATAHATLAFEVCSKCGVLRVNPQLVPELTDR
ncbi:MAG TPA: hypothetical protein VNM14_06325 [Planctomycetota bacterium]|jgi:hypothetical protein|nr:hypothetical protein [Planctomycetota bacterium]